MGKAYGKRPSEMWIGSAYALSFDWHVFSRAEAQMNGGGDDGR